MYWGEKFDSWMERQRMGVQLLIVLSPMIIMGLVIMVLSVVKEEK